MSELSGVEARTGQLVSEAESAAYDPVSKLLHWGIAVAVFAMLAFGFYLDALPFSEAKVALIQLHKSSGVAIAVFVLLRLARRMRDGFLPLSESETAIRRRVVRCVHFLLLLLPVGMVVTGVLRSLAYGRSVRVFGAPFIPAVMEKNEPLHEAASSAHAVFAWVFLACIVLHAAAALWHHLVKRDATLTRMLPATLAKQAGAVAKVAR